MGNHQYVCGNGKYCNANATTPKPPSTHIAENYKNAYETAFEAEGNVSLNKYPLHILVYFNLPLQFINGTFGYEELYNNISVSYLSIKMRITTRCNHIYLYLQALEVGTVICI